MRRKLYIDKKNQNKQKGFTLIELLAVIVIITLISTIVVYSVITIINNSKEKSIAMTKKNILKTASTYVNETEDIVWTTDPTNSNNLISCVNIQELINMGYYDESILENEAIKSDNIYFVIVKKDISSRSIISEEFDNTTTCENTFKYVSTPTCKTLTYNGSSQALIDETTNNNINFTNNSGTNAGSYNVKITPKNGYVWNDGTNTEKTKTCTINKAKTKVTLNPAKETDTSVTTTQYTTTATPTITSTHTSEISGTLTVKTIENTNNINNIDPNNKSVTTNTSNNITITTKDIRNTNTTIKINFTPNDTTNYEGSYANYKIPSMDMDGIYTVTLDLNGGNFNSSTSNRQFLITKNKKYGEDLITPTMKGYTFNGWYTAQSGGTKIDKSTIFGYDKNITLYAQYNIVNYTITYNLNGGTVTTANPTTYNINTATFTLKNPKKTGYTFKGWTGSNGTTPQTEVSISKGETGNKTYTANWTRNFTCASNGGTTTYAGLQWTTISKTSTSCELALNGTSKTSGSYNSATTNLTNEYLTNGGSSYNSTMITEMNAGLLYKVNGNYYIDTNSGTSGNHSGNYWYTSNYVYFNSSFNNCNLTKTTVTYYKGGRDTKSTGLEGITKSRTGNYSVPSCSTIHGGTWVDNNSSTKSYTGYTSSTTNDTGFSSSYISVRFSKSGNTFTMNYGGSSQNGNRHYLYGCGGSSTDNNTNAYIYRVRKISSKGSITGFYVNNKNTGAETDHYYGAPGYAGKIYFYLAGHSFRLNSDADGYYYLKPSCYSSYTTYSSTSKSVSIYYRPHIKVKI